MHNRSTRSFRHGGIDLLTILIFIGVAGIATLAFLSYLQKPLGALPPNLAQGVPSDAVGWWTDFNAAVRESKSKHKPIIIDFTASWCPPCQYMKKEVWTDPRVILETNARFIPVLIDVDQQPAIAREFNINTVPTIKVLPNGDEPCSEEFHGVDADTLLGILRRYAAR